MRSRTLESDAIVMVGEKTLYYSELNGLLQPDMLPEDSARVIQAYTKNWIENELLYIQAKKNISETREIEELVENYRQSLIVTEYETQLLEQKIKKNISERELRSYLEQNRESFLLKEHIVKGLFLKIPVESPELDNYKKWYKLGTSESLHKIEQNIIQNSVAYDQFFEKWVKLDAVLENMPGAISDTEAFLKRNQTQEVSDSSFVYLFYIKEYKIKGEEAPFDYISEIVLKVYIENKRNEFSENMKKDLYSRALDKGEIIFYKQ